MTNNNYQNKPIDEEHEIHQLINSISEPPIENENKSDITMRGKLSAIFFYTPYEEGQEQDVTTTQPSSGRKILLENIAINTEKYDPKKFKNDLDVLDEDSKRILKTAIDECYKEENFIQYFTHYCYGIFDCVLISCLAMQGFCCCPKLAALAPMCPLPL